MTTIRKVTPKPGYKLLVELENGHEVTYDLGARLHTVRFADLRHFGRFEAFDIIDQRIIRWNPYCQITVDEILESIQR